MIFWITTKVRYKNYRLMVVHTVINERIEHFKIIGKNKSIVLESNRPLFRNRGLKHRNPDFKLIEGSVDFIGSLDVLYEEILKVVDSDN